MPPIRLQIPSPHGPTGQLFDLDAHLDRERPVAGQHLRQVRRADAQVGSKLGRRTGPLAEVVTEIHAPTLAHAKARSQAYAQLAIAKLLLMKTDTELAGLRRERLRLLCEERSQTALAAATGISLSQLGQWLGGNRNVSEASARRIERGARLPKGWLDNEWKDHPGELGTSGDAPASNAEVLYSAPSEPLRLPAARSIPVVGSARLGDGGLYVELEHAVGHGDGSVWFPSDDPGAYCVRCKGDSMTPRIQHGEFAVVEPNHQVAPGDEVLVKVADERVMIKRLRYIRDGRVYLDSINSAAHEPIVLDIEDVGAIHYVAAVVKSVFYRPG